MLALEAAARPGTHDLAARLRRCSAEARGLRRTRVALTAAFILIFSVTAFFVFRSMRTHPATAGLATNPVAREKSIAVLPFENLSRDPDNAFFTDGVQGEILTRLSKIAELKVISRTSTQHYKSAPENLPALTERAMAVVPIEKDTLWGPQLIERLARVAAGLGEPDRAIAALRKVLSTPYDSRLTGFAAITPALLRLDPMFDPLRSDPRFQALCKDSQP